MIKLASWNVNGLRSILSKGFEEYLKSEAPDIVCLQEIKAFHKDVEHLTKNILNNYEIILNPATRPGYSGTGMLIKKGKVFENYKYISQCGKSEFDDEGRFQLLETDQFYLFNGYYPNGKDDHSRVDFKLEYSFMILDWASKLKKNKPVFITGDLNTAHTEIDLKNPKTNKYTTGFLNIEREFIDQLIAAGFIDTYRHHHPNKIDAYSWWSYRNGAREKNVGWRLDYFFANQEISGKIISAEIKHEILGSDHCPVHLLIEL
jgi:exodeoxyribonuclease-3